MGNSKSKQEKEATTPQPPPPPKHLLWGCPTVVSHYDYIVEALRKTQDCHGETGLAILGFEYRMVHAQSCTCRCQPKDDNNTTDHSKTNYDDSSFLEDLHESQTFMVPIKDDDDDDDEEIDSNNSKEDKSNLNNNDVSNNTTNNTSMILSPSALDLLAMRYESIIMDEETTYYDKRTISRISSATSMFSLNTHASFDYDESGAPILNPSKLPVERQGCGLRLCHVPSGEFVSECNWQTYIAPGKMYDVVTRLCIEIAQEEMIKEGDLEWISIDSNNGDDLVEPDGNAVRLLISRQKPQNNNNNNSKKSILLIIPGKGQVGAGIFSRRHLLTSGMEVSTALPFVREAVKTRNMEVVMFDPNQILLRSSKSKKQNSMTTVETSFQYFVERSNNNKKEKNNDIFVLAHSMGGSQWTRYFLNNNESNNDRSALLRQIKAIAFTDSNHNINWCKDNTEVSDFLQGSCSLYIKSHKVHEDQKVLGELHHDCHFWQHRFGAIQTIWAGTNEHALTNYTARYYIWNHFDSFLSSSSNEGEEEEEDDDDEMIPSF
mmetsp:Transcript_28869/g.44108  ORF Transcript_28869/g.44108 Transcript_28869/m.44108 type:complete len:546 (+) Transcript_28869:131-1768(+)